jgi:tRNA G46 methylase TrmB
MRANSKLITSAQQTIHPQLQALVLKHLRHDWQQPLHQATVTAFQRLLPILRTLDRPILLDSGCGTGASTLLLASQHPGHWLIGIDQSASRLQRLAADGLGVYGNAILLRAELECFWRLWVAAGWRAEKNYLLYPNPWPKAAQIGRRWHGHPVFPRLLQTAAQFELRSNWRLYVDEFALAASWLGARVDAVAAAVIDTPLTPFERKYHDSGQTLWRVQIGTN